MLRHSAQNASIRSRIAIGFLRSIAINLNIVESLVSLQAKTCNALSSNISVNVCKATC